MESSLDGWLDEEMKDEWLAGWMDGWLAGFMDKWMA
jgi:hypothetical protein